MSSREPLSARLVNYLIADRAALAPNMVAECPRALREACVPAEGGSLPDWQGRHERMRAVAVREWLRQAAAGLQTEWPATSQRTQADLEHSVIRGGERREALALERRGMCGDVVAERRRVTLGSYARLFAKGVGGIAFPDARSGPEFGRQITAIMRREAPQRRAVDQDPFEAWAGSPVGGALQEAHTAAAPPLRHIMRMRGLAGVGSHIRTLCSALGEARYPAGEGSPAR